MAAKDKTIEYSDGVGRTENMLFGYNTWSSKRKAAPTTTLPRTEAKTAMPIRSMKVVRDLQTERIKFVKGCLGNGL